MSAAFDPEWARAVRYLEAAYAYRYTDGGASWDCLLNFALASAATNAWEAAGVIKRVTTSEGEERWLGRVRGGRWEPMGSAKTNTQEQRSQGSRGAARTVKPPSGAPSVIHLAERARLRRRARRREGA